jgi:hypothetical protein
MIDHIINPSQMKVEPIPYPEKEIEHIITQIIRLTDECKHNDYNHNIDETLTILNNMLKMLTKPILVMKND